MFNKMNMLQALAVQFLHHICLHGWTTAGTQKSALVSEVVRNKEMLQLLKLMELPPGSTVIIIQEYNIGQLTSKVIDDWIMQNGLVILSVQVSDFKDTMTHFVQDVMRKKTLEAYRSMLNFVVLCDDCLLRMHDMIRRTFNDYAEQTLLRHFSKWLFIYMKEIREGIPRLDTVLDNVAIAFKRMSNMDRSTAIPEDTSSSPLLESKADTRETDESTGCMVIQTLLWKPVARQWSDVGFLIQPNNSMHVFGLLFPNTQYGLNGRKLKIGAMEWATYCRKTHTQDNSSVSYAQVCRDVCDYLSTSLNFSYVFVEPPDHSWGERLPNSSWSGLLGMTERNEVDLVAVPYGQTRERRKVVSFTAMIMSSRYQVCYNKKYTERTYWASLTMCFKWEVYACGSVVLLWCVGLLSLMETTSAERPGEQRMKPYLCKGDLSWIIFTGISVPLHQGSGYQPLNVSGSILYVSWWMFCIIITTVYTGNLVAFLAVSKEKTPFTSLEELAENAEYGILVSRGSYIENQLRISGVGTMKVLWQKAVASRTTAFNNSLDEYDQQRRLLQSGKYALIEVSHSVDHLKQTITNLRRMPRDVISLPMFLPLPLESPLELIMSEEIRLLYDSGIMAGLERKWSTGNTLTKNEVTYRSQLEIADLQSAFIACAVGMFVAVMCLTVEYMFNHVKLPKCRQHNEEQHIQ